MYVLQTSRELEPKETEQIHHKQDHDAGIFLNTSGCMHA